jgi:hypothetical protein
MTSSLNVLWPVQPGAEHEHTRPAVMVRELERLGVTFGARLAHGRPDIALDLRSRRIEIRRAPWIRSTPFGGSEDRYCSWTPLIADVEDQRLAWFDGYDDWSLSPEIPLASRVLARRTYNGLHNSDDVVRTANTRYMCNRLGPDTVLIPNGCQVELGDARTNGDDQLRFIVLGSLHRKRLDARVIESLVALPFRCSFVFGGPELTDFASRARAMGHDVTHRPKVPLAHLGNVVGDRTVAVLPLRVNDYTLSQDPMKTYDYLALGMPVLAPRLLWPSHLPIERAMLFEDGDDIAELALAASTLGLETPSWRQSFAVRQSWAQRARQLRQVLADDLEI